MANEEHLARRLQGEAAWDWNEWREHNPQIVLDLRGASLIGRDLTLALLDRVDLAGADLRKANLHWGHLSGANLTGATLMEAILCGADLTGADLCGTDLTGIDFTEAAKGKIPDDSTLND
jgi:uncharacterized protein YjbI with pentapeptide repeats